MQPIAKFIHPRPFYSNSTIKNSNDRSLHRIQSIETLRKEKISTPLNSNIGLEWNGLYQQYMYTIWGPDPIIEKQWIDLKKESIEINSPAFTENLIEENALPLLASLPIIPPSIDPITQQRSYLKALSEKRKIKKLHPRLYQLLQNTPSIYTGKSTSLHIYDDWIDQVLKALSTVSDETFTKDLKNEIKPYFLFLKAHRYIKSNCLKEAKPLLIKVVNKTGKQFLAIRSYLCLAYISLELKEEDFTQKFLDDARWISKPFRQNTISEAELFYLEGCLFTIQGKHNKALHAHQKAQFIFAKFPHTKNNIKENNIDRISKLKN